MTLPDTPLNRLDDSALQRLDDLLQRITPEDEALDLPALDGFLAGVALQPRPIPEAQWLPFLHDAEGRPWPAQARTHAGLTLAQRDALAQGARLRLAELQHAIRQRQWFDPWLLIVPPDGHDDEQGGDEDDLAFSVTSWVAGFSLATNAFPDLLALGTASGPPMFEALALLYRHLDPDDVDLEPELIDAIEALEPPMQADDLVEDLVCATLLLADLSQPLRRAGPAAGRRPTKRPVRPPARGG